PPAPPEQDEEQDQGRRALWEAFEENARSEVSDFQTGQITGLSNRRPHPAKGRRHEEDLVAMEPTKEEINHGLNWLRSWPSNEAFKKRLAFLVEGLGFGELL
ncbi:MAG: hypothetical protein NTV93_21290, partial [Verrucomicrobia bacterium]|nr:hypothetical protein [Verrucomicrobiota bacterium]